MSKTDDDIGKRGNVYTSFPHIGRRLIISSSILIAAYWLTAPSSSSSSSLEALDDHERIAILRGHREQISHGMISHTDGSKLGFWLKEGLSDEFTPKVAWLMAWPESGDKYVTETIQRVTNQSTATNYGEQVTLPSFISIPIYPLHKEGPFWEGLAGQFGNKIRKLPERNALTLTHCSNRCFMDCSPKDYYDESESSFTKACCTTSAQVAPKAQLTTFEYPIEHVTKAIHLIRNPFHNVIERFRMEREKHKNDVGFLEEYPELPKKGFQKWCAVMDDKYEKDDEKIYSKAHWKLAKNTLCHAEFYKYVQWHNHAFRTTRHLPSNSKMVVYYEDFYTKLDDTIQAMLNLLELDRVDKPYNFSSPHDYSRFYSAEMRQAVKKFVKELASKDTWEYLKHYFEPGNIDV
jgi:hypothetical protein